jgi:histidine triad (HIT) family protein
VSDCIFCRIAAGQAPCFEVCADANVLVFMDLFPVAPGHTLVVTRGHFENLFETPPAVMAAVATTTQRVARAIRRELAPAGLGVYQLNGAAAGQTVFHYHTHLIPRQQGDALALHGRRQGEAAELAALAGRLRSALEAEADPG